jgi:hypothetical protein
MLISLLTQSTAWACMGFQSARFKIEKPDTIGVSSETRPRHAYKSISIISQTHRAFSLPDGDQDVLFRVAIFDVDGPEGCDMIPLNITLIPLTNGCEFKIVRTVWGGCRWVNQHEVTGRLSVTSEIDVVAKSPLRLLSYPVVSPQHGSGDPHGCQVRIYRGSGRFLLRRLDGCY